MAADHDPDKEARLELMQAFLENRRKTAACDVSLGYQEFMREAIEYRQNLVADSTLPDGFLSLKRAADGRTVYIKAPNGVMGSIPYTEFEKIKGHFTEKCLRCQSGFRLDFNTGRKPVLALICEVCAVIHVVMDDGTLCDVAKRNSLRS